MLDFLRREGEGGDSPRVSTASISQEKCGIWLERPSRSPPPIRPLMQRHVPTEVGAGHADPSLSSAMPRHGAILSLVGMAGRGGEGRRFGHLEKMAMSNGAVFFLCGGLWDGAAESVTV